MPIFELLKSNKGTTSSELGKKLAGEMLKGKKEILKEAVELSSYLIHEKKEKIIRAGAAKIVECVAEKKAELVVPYLEKLLSALEADEPQTRWMIIRTFGFCAELAPEFAKKALPFAKKYIHEKKDGQLCLVSSADIYLGDYGKVSKQSASEAFKILLESSDNVIANEHNWILESFVKIANLLSREQKTALLEITKEFSNIQKKRTQDLIKKLNNLCK